MMMKKTLFAVAASLTAAVCIAEDVEADDSAEVAVEAAPAKAFAVLPICREAEGNAEVRIPLSEEWQQAEVGKFYPLGSTYRVRKGTLKIGFGGSVDILIEGEADFGTRAQALGEDVRAIVLGTGVVSINAPLNLREGALFVAAPGFAAKNLAGESKFTRKATGDGDEVVVRCVTGTLGIDGKHFNIPAMRAADEVKIRSSADFLETFLYGESGDYILKLDQGVATKNVINDDGDMETVTAASFLDWHLSPKTKVRISRRAPAICTRLSVAVMTFDAVGAMKNNFAFTEGRAEVNSGELVRATKEEAKKLAKDADAIAAGEKVEDNNNEEEE